MRAGIDRRTGKVLTSWAHCAQSISTILTTVIGSRVMRRTFGSDVPALIDRPGNNSTFVLFVGRTAAALKKWEPGFRLTKVNVLQMSGDGRSAFELVGDFYEDGHLGIYGAPTRVSAAYDVAGMLVRAA